MKNNQKGFGAVEIIIIIVILAIIGVGIWYAMSRNASAPTTQPGPNATSSQNTNSQTGWKTVTFMPDNLKINVPSSVKTDEMLELKSGRTAPEPIVINLEKGYSLYVTQIGDPKTDNAYGNAANATEYSSFANNGQQYYITNSTITLDVSTCQTKVCAIPLKSDPNKSVLVQVYYRNPAISGQQAADAIPLEDPYLETVKQILKSIVY